MFSFIYRKVMTNKKKILIETLHGSVAQLNELSSMTEGVDIYDNTGHVDTDFLIEAISCVSAFMDASNIVVEKISSLLAPDVPIAEKEKQADEGKKWSVEEILKHCTLENNILKLPQVQFHAYNKESFIDNLVYSADTKVMNYTRSEGITASVYEMSVPISYSKYFFDDYLYLTLENKNTFS